MKKSFLLASAAIVALSTAASAATFSLVGGSTGTIPEAGQTNDVLENVFGFAPGDSLLGEFGAQVEVDSDTDIVVNFWGFEAAADNDFTLTGVTSSAFFDTSAGSSAYALDALTPISSTTVDVLAGELSFAFTTSIGGGLSAINGSNPDNSGADANFFSWLSSDRKNVFVFFDDTGAGDDDNHDDFVVSFSISGGNPGQPSPVPLPAGGLLLIGGLGALAAVRRRKNKS